MPYLKSIDKEIAIQPDMEHKFNFNRAKYEDKKKMVEALMNFERNHIYKKDIQCNLHK